MNRIVFYFSLFLCFGTTLHAQVPGTGIYYYNWHVNPDHKAVMNAIKAIPKKIYYTPEAINFRVVRNSLFAELGITYIVVAKNKNTAKVLFLADSLAMQQTFRERIASDSIFPNTLLHLYRNREIQKWVHDRSTSAYRTDIFKNFGESHKYRFWQEDNRVTDCFSLQLTETELLEYSSLKRDTLDYLTHQIQKNITEYNVRLYYDQFKRHTDDCRIKLVDILPNIYKKSIPIYKNQKKGSPIVGYWDIDKYACVEKKLAANWMKVRVYYTKIVEENTYSGKMKTSELMEIEGYIQVD